MSDNWLDELRQLRETDEAKLDPPEPPQPPPKPESDLLRESLAHKLLRGVQKTLLAGEGALDRFDQWKGYDRAIALIWQGPISNARRPDPNDTEPYNYIIVGVNREALWVNGRKVSSATPEALEKALVRASKSPLRESNRYRKRQ